MIRSRLSSISASADKWRVARPLISLAWPTKRKPSTSAPAFGSRDRSLKRNLPPAFIDPRRAGFVQEIETVTAPAPLLGQIDESALHRIVMPYLNFSTRFFVVHTLQSRR